MPMVPPDTLAEIRSAFEVRRRYCSLPHLLAAAKVRHYLLSTTLVVFARRNVN